MPPTKHCNGCQLDLEISFFYAKGKNRLQSYCKSCLCERQIQRWIKRKLAAIEYKGGGCSQCGYNRNYAALDFHHTDPSEKEVMWNRLRLRNWKQVLVELDKCVLLCKNCHTELHHPQGNLRSFQSKSPDIDS